MTTNLFKKLEFIRIAFVASVGISFLIATGANAQEPGVATTETVVVTGSNIPTAEEVTASNVDILTTQDIKVSGQNTDLLQILQKRDPNFVGGGNLGQSNANISSGGTQGGSIISIRGLPTLVLFEGRRIVDSAAIATGGAQFTDASLFPTSLISRIEVLKDGASAIYGSDAVGGVVNIFMKRDFNGLEVGYRYGFTLEGAVAERRGYTIAGTGNDTTHVTVGFQYYEIDPMYQHERAWSSLPGGLTTTFFGSGRDAGSPPTTNDRGRVLIAPGDANHPGFHSPFDNGVLPGSIAPGVSQYLDPAMNGTYVPATFGAVTAFDLATKPTNTLGIENTNAYADFDHQICGKTLEAFGNFMYSHNTNESFLNAQPLSNGTGVVILGTLRVDPNNTGGPLIAENRGPAAAWNPFQQSLDGFSLAGVNRLTIGNRYQSNPRIFDNDSNFYRLLGGLKSQISKDWTAEAAAYYSHYGINYVNSNLVNANQLNAMIAGTAVDNNGIPIPAFDFFRNNPVGTGPGQVSAAAFSTIFGANIRKQDSFQNEFDIKIVGFPFELPGGAVGVAVGANYAIDGFKVKDSPEIFIGSVPILEINRHRYVESFYGETSIPIVGSKQEIPWIYSMDLTIAGRFDHYQHVKEDAKVPKYTLRYQPIKDLTLRATYSNSFIAPTLYQLFGPRSQGFSDTITLNGVIQDQAQVQSGSNPDLVPSTAESYTAGLVYSPSYINGLTITCDYFRTLQQKIVSAYGGQTILSSVDRLGTASPFWNQVTFNNFPGRPGAVNVTGPNQLDGNLAAVFYSDFNINLGAARVEGFDLSASYLLELHQWGQFNFGIKALVFTLNDLKRTPNTDYYNISGLVGPEFSGSISGANPDYKLNFLAEYRVWGFTLSVNANYIPEMKNIVGNDAETVDQGTLPTVQDYITFDGRLSYEFHRTPTPGAPAVVSSKDAKNMDKNPVPGPAVFTCFDRLIDGTTLTVGCNNIADEEPRFVAGANSATSLSTYDPYGRFVYFEIAKKF